MKKTQKQHWRVSKLGKAFQAGHGAGKKEVLKPAQVKAFSALSGLTNKLKALQAKEIRGTAKAQEKRYGFEDKNELRAGKLLQKLPGGLAKRLNKHWFKDTGGL